MTNVENFTNVRDFLISNNASQEMIDFIQTRIDLTIKKNSRKSTELTETQKENLELKGNVLEYITNNPNITSKMLTKHFGVSSQKLTPILSRLVLDNEIMFTVEKKVKYFSAC